MNSSFDAGSTCCEEWRSQINDVPGEVGKLCPAAGCVWVSPNGAEPVDERR